jgi:hypothetical protein
VAEEKEVKTPAQEVPEPGSAPAGTATTQAPDPGERQIRLDEGGVNTGYVNFCFTAGTREGILIGLGNHDWQGQNPIKVESKVEMSYFNSKRLLAALNQIVKKHEETFGAVEIDVNNRLKK